MFDFHSHVQNLFLCFECVACITHELTYSISKETHFFIENNPTSNNKYFLQIYRRWAKPVYVRDTITWYGRLARLTALPATPHDKQYTYHQFTLPFFPSYI